MAVNGVTYNPQAAIPRMSAGSDFVRPDQTRDLEASLPGRAAQDAAALQNEQRAAELRASMRREEQEEALQVDPQKMVLRPSEVPLEDRLKLVMSLEEVQRLLLIRSPYQPGGEHAKASAAQEAQGRLINALG